MNIVERDLNLAEITKDNVNEMVARALAEPEPVLAQNTAEEPVTVAPVETVNIGPVDKPVSKPETAKTRIVKPARKKPVATTNETASLDPQQGVYYRIQLAAGHKSINIGRYFQKMNLEKDVRLETHDGWKKYSIGSFELYRDARDYRVHIWNTTPVKDAFITAYNSGQRITVQEALMISDQKWYR